ncbi:hypothetical protein FHX34_104255 [Actinoplanes teichomyceticus]|uniref:Uncharacterized protein n=1 Tax=Actinoplanes teichomyceticus TaxID=1867 RepID=A0A561VQT0_ACTTI|nr:hypothetical protein FHX34_104255 [Actinoplanes teichomyceticus]
MPWRLRIRRWQRWPRILQIIGGMEGALFSTVPGQRFAGGQPVAAGWGSGLFRARPVPAAG